MPAPKIKRQAQVKKILARPRNESSDSRSTLLSSAQKLFGQNGYKATSVHDIARDADLNVSLVSYHFGGKEGLFKECFAQAGLYRLQMAEKILNCKPSSLDEVRVRLSMFIDEIMLDGIQNPEVFSIIQRELTAEFDILGDTFKGTFLQTFELLTKFISVAKDRGILSSWTDPNLTAVHLIGSAMHTIRTDDIRSKIFKKSIRDQSVRAMTRDYLVRIFLEGVANR